VLELYFYPWTRWEEYKPIIIEAKNMVIPEYKVKPSQATFLCGRFVAVETPPFLGDYALMKSKNVDSWKNALLWAFNVTDNPGAHGIIGQLENIFGHPVVELNIQEGQVIKATAKNVELW